MSITRRGFMGHAGAALGIGLFGGVGRATAEPSQPALPAIGQTIRLSLNGFGATLSINTPPPAPTLNFIGSRVVQVLAGGADYVRLRTVDFTAEAAHPMFGKITMRLPDISTDADGVLKVVSPGRLAETWVLSMQVSFEQCGDCQGPFIFYPHQPAQWTAELTGFPPPPLGMNPDGSSAGGALYRLSRPIRLTTTPPTGPGSSGQANPDPEPARQAAANPSCGTCPLGTPLPGDDSTFAVFETLDFHQGQMT